MSFSNDRERTLTDVWDWPTRILHWTNAILIITLALLMIGKEGMEILGVEKALRRPVNELHAYIGYIFAFTFSLRIVWAFIGNKYARWADIIPYSKEGRQAIGHNIKWYLSGFKGRAAKAIGHDPLASLFYIALFIVLASQVVTGLLLSGAEFKMFPGSLFTSGLGEEGLEALEGALEEVHEFGFMFIIFFFFAHLAGLVVHEVKEKTGLFSSMIHGRKYFTRDE
ncbi:MAG: cytochrome b/b6 domain-containing protein [Deltaproteobacteria bacterium]|nr:cytochrome b/b6 domain-containing protein [Deltaproteobacteria bacterium]